MDLIFFEFVISLWEIRSGLEQFSVLFLRILASRAPFGKFQIARMVGSDNVSQLQDLKTTSVNYGPYTLVIFHLKKEVSISLKKQKKSFTKSFTKSRWACWFVFANAANSPYVCSEYWWCHIVSVMGW